MTKDEVLNRLKELAISLGTPRLGQKEIRLVQGLESSLRLHFTGLSNALKEAGLEPTLLAKKMATTDKELIDYIFNLGKKIGKQPTIFDVRRDGVFSEVIFNKRFGKFGIRKAYELSKKESKLEIINQNKDNQGSNDYEKVEYLKDFPNKPLFWGRAGETYIVAELMYRGYNASILPVDLGVDVMAIKDGKTFFFQVKNISFDKTNSRTIPITTSSFSKNQSNNVFYIFILQRGSERDVLILPYQAIHAFIKKKLISFNEENKDFSICISLNKESVNIHLPTDKNKFEDVSNHRNDWDVIV